MAGRLHDLLTLVLLVAMATTGMHCLTCRDENRQPVDWFVVYKLPSSGPADGGRTYVYRSSGRPDVGDAGDDVSWIRSERKISDAESLPGRTLEPLYEYANEQAESHLLLMYNDELPNGTSSGTAAHAKGVVAFDRSGGFWLLHSVPRFPPTDGPYDYPPTGTKFGQTMLCISLPFRLANDVGVQLTFYDPLVYKWRICDDLIDQVPDLAAVGSGQRRRQPPPGLSLRPLTSLAGAEALSFAKSARFGKDLYADWMAPTLQSSLLVETWTNGDGHVMPSDCRAPFKVHNVQQVNVTPATNFSSHRDHSKWAVARRSAKPWICIADINRMVGILICIWAGGHFRQRCAHIRPSFLLYGQGCLLGGRFTNSVTSPAADLGDRSVRNNKTQLGCMLPLSSSATRGHFPKYRSPEGRARRFFCIDLPTGTCR